jgi:signal transduction histidine kinase
MDERLILLAQVLTLRQKLDRVAHLLVSSQLDADLRSRVQARFDRLLKRQRFALDQVENKISSGEQLPLCWDGFRSVRNESEAIFRETLAFMEGALIRGARIDNGICRIADSILDDLSRKADIPWERFTIFATDEFFGNMAEIIRLRFPEANIWHLPVAVHEFGHFVAQELKTPGTFRYPFQEILRREQDKGPQYISFLHEFFADIFATYAAGPALTYTCVVLRFDPGTSQLASRTHPPDAKRVYVLLKTLQRMDQTSGSPLPHYGDTIRELAQLWHESLEANMQLTELAAAEAAQLDAMLDELFQLMLLELPGVRYTGWLRAQTLSTELQADGDSLPQPGEKDSLLDVINAAWLWRMHTDQGNPLATNQISAKAIKMCEQIMAGGNA